VQKWVLDAPVFDFFWFFVLIPSPPPFVARAAALDRYRDQDQLMSVAQGYIDRSLPISAIVIDYFHWSDSH
jgi:hypothetical protein